MNADNLVPAPAARTNFRRDRYRDVPSASGCYVLASFAGFILYVGLASSLRRRFEEHLDNPDKVGVTKHGAAYWFYWLQAKRLEPLERGWMNQYQVIHAALPILNRANSPLSL